MFHIAASVTGKVKARICYYPLCSGQLLFRYSYTFNKGAKPNKIMPSVLLENPLGALGGGGGGRKFWGGGGGE